MNGINYTNDPRSVLIHFNPNNDKLGRFAKSRFGGSKSSSKTVDKSDKKDYNKIDKEKLKKYVKIGAGVVATSLLVAGGVYLVKSGKFNDLVNAGKSRVGDAIDIVGADKINTYTSEHKNIIDGKIPRLPKPESIAEASKNANPNRGNITHKNNCTVSAITGIMRTLGYDVVAPHTNGKMQNLNGVVEDCFSFGDEKIRSSHVKDWSAVKFGKSPEAASEVLIRAFGQNASGVCNIMWKDGGGHAFAWIIKDGNVSFFCPQKGFDDTTCRTRFWNGNIDLNGALQMARIDDLPINIEGFKKWFG